MYVSVQKKACGPFNCRFLSRPFKGPLGERPHNLPHSLECPGSLFLWRIPRSLYASGRRGRVDLSTAASLSLSTSQRSLSPPLTHAGLLIGSGQLTVRATSSHLLFCNMRSRDSTGRASGLPRRPRRCFVSSRDLIRISHNHFRQDSHSHEIFGEPPGPAPDGRGQPAPALAAAPKKALWASGTGERRTFPCGTACL